MPLIAIVGNLGTGKTLLLTLKALFYSQHNFHIYTNYRLKEMNYTILDEPLEILEIETKPNVILGDEFYHWFDCYETDKKILKAMRNVINATRKKNTIVIASIHRITQLSLKYRDILDEIHFPYLYKELDILDDEVCGFPLKYGLDTFMIETLYSQRYYNVSTVFNYYDHEEIIKDFFDFEGTQYNRLREKQELVNDLTRIK